MLPLAAISRLASAAQAPAPDEALLSAAPAPIGNGMECWGEGEEAPAAGAGPPSLANS